MCTYVYVSQFVSDKLGQCVVYVGEYVLISFQGHLSVY